jgi:hypothetical protein
MDGGGCEDNPFKSFSSSFNAVALRDPGDVFGARITVVMGEDTPPPAPHPIPEEGGEILPSASMGSPPIARQVRAPSYLKSAFVDSSFSDEDEDEDEEDDDDEDFYPNVHRRKRIKWVAPTPIPSSPPPPPASTIRPFTLFIVTAIICIALSAAAYRSFRIGSVANHLLNNIEEYVDGILRDRHHHRHHNKRSGITTTTIEGVRVSPNHPIMKRSGPYELWSEQHNTTSHAIDYTMEQARSTALVLRASFLQHMQQQPGGKLACMCMHHIHVDRLQKSKDAPLIIYQLCGVYNAHEKQLYMMANPRKSGGGSKEPSVELMEHSVSCPKDHWRTVRRHEVLFLDWVDPFTRQGRYRLFSGDESYCMQLALEEMAPGNAHCDVASPPPPTAKKKTIKLANDTYLFLVYPNRS